jgi:hypothetical protein
MRRWIACLLALFALAAGSLPAPGHAQSPDTTPAPAVAPAADNTAVPTNAAAPGTTAAPSNAAPSSAPAASNAAAPSAAGTAGNAPARANVGELLTAVSLTEADVPRGLALDRNRSGLRTADNGAPTYTVAFVADGSGDRTLMGVLNQLGQYPDPAAGFNAVTERYLTNLSGNRTDLPPPAVGEASRAFTVTTSVMGGSMSASTAVVALRRGDVVASVAVASVGTTPQVDVALRLAQAVDQRLSAALNTGS